MNKVVLSFAFVVLLVAYTLAFWPESEVDNQPMSMPKPMVEASDSHVTGAMSNTSINQSPQSTAALYQPNWSEQEKRAIFKRSRNAWLADPTLSDEAKQLYIRSLANQYWDDASAIPELTEDDLVKQQALKGVLQQLQHETYRIKTDSTMSRQEKQQALKQLLLNYVRDRQVS